jgi:hypothetical protein
MHLLVIPKHKQLTYNCLKAQSYWKLLHFEIATWDNLNRREPEAEFCQRE